jgi:hypothetical protein
MMHKNVVGKKEITMSFLPFFARAPYDCAFLLGVAAPSVVRFNMNTCSIYCIIRYEGSNNPHIHTHICKFAWVPYSV